MYLDRQTVYPVNLVGCCSVHLMGGVAKVHKDENAKRVKGSFATEKMPSQGRIVASKDLQQMTSTPFKYTRFHLRTYLLKSQDSRTRAPG
jgi:hypothetical protein